MTLWPRTDKSPQFDASTWATVDIVPPNVKDRRDTLVYIGTFALVMGSVVITILGLLYATSLLIRGIAAIGG